MNTRLEGGCPVPIGSYAELKDGELWLRALVGARMVHSWCAANDAGQRNKRKPSASRWRKSFWIMAPARFSRRFMMEKPRDEHPGHSSTTARRSAGQPSAGHGTRGWSFPLIEFTHGRELPALGDALARLGPDDLLFALSQHAVEFAHARLQQQGLPRPLLRAILPLAARRRWPCIRSVGSISITR